ncbi:alpha/beta hydrolase [Geminicoccus flavidas]|uniref:alpha/beta hydrolase n=1 Tax=Geminicoccus flavidas TaxID=2506407 RepID=UPI001357E5A9|nr:alpha/beta hydrolase [Geminicoccus flavidas]
MMLPWLALILALYLAIVGSLYLAQDGLLFPHGATRRGMLPLPEGTVRHELVTADGHRLVGHALRRNGSRDIALLFTGNAWNAEDCLIFTAERLPDVNLLAFHYRGYAPSEGAPSETALVADALLLRAQAERLLGLEVMAEPLRMFAIGYSIGSGVAAQLAGQGQVDGAILVTPFDSVEAVARQRYFFAPVSLLLRHPFRSDLALADKQVPVAVIAAGRDRIVPPTRTEALVARLARPVLVATVPQADHVTLYDLPEFDQLLEQALRAVQAAEPLEAVPVNDR